MSKDPNLALRTCTPADIPALALLNHACFTAPGNQIMYGKVTPSDRLRVLEEGFDRQMSGNHPSQHVNSLCIIDTTTNSIISHAIWIFLPEGYIPSEDADCHHPWLPVGTNEKLRRDFDRMTQELRSAHPGRKEKHWLLSLLATHPEHEGRGAGSMLIQWGLDKADEMRVRTYVDASVAGFPVYKKRGFEEEVGVLELNLREYEGGEGLGVQRWVALMREPRKVGGKE